VGLVERAQETVAHGRGPRSGPRPGAAGSGAPPRPKNGSSGDGLPPIAIA